MKSSSNILNLKSSVVKFYKKMYRMKIDETRAY